MSTNGRPPDDNDTIWQAFTRHIKPIKREKKSEEKPPQKSLSHKTVTKKITPQPQTAITLKPLQEKQKPTLDGRRKDKLRKGKIPVEGTIDLHGMTQAQAHRKLNNFVTRAHAEGKRCLLVITGKGSRSESGVGVIKSKLPDWINLPPLSDYVLDYVSAHRKDGGDGAFYLYLRRK